MLHVELSKGSGADALSGYFNELGSIDMLGAEDYNNVETVSPFMEAIVNRCCGLDNASFTLSYVGQAEIINAV